MPLSMAVLRSETLEHLGIDATDLDASGSANLDLLINRSWWDICDRFKFKEKELSATFSTVIGTRSYLLQTIASTNVFEAIQYIWIVDPNTGNHIRLDPISLEWYENNYNESDDQQAQPTNYFHNNGYIYLWPTPNAVYDMGLWYNYVLSDLTAGNPSIPQSWHESILYGAVARGHRRARDYNSAAQMEQMLEVSISRRATTESKEDSSIKMSGMQVYHNPYSVTR